MFIPRPATFHSACSHILAGALCLLNTRSAWSSTTPITDAAGNEHPPGDASAVRFTLCGACDHARACIFREHLTPNARNLIDEAIRTELEYALSGDDPQAFDGYDTTCFEDVNSALRQAADNVLAWQPQPTEIPDAASALLDYLHTAILLSSRRVRDTADDPDREPQTLLSRFFESAIRRCRNAQERTRILPVAEFTARYALTDHAPLPLRSIYEPGSLATLDDRAVLQAVADARDHCRDYF